MLITAFVWIIGFSITAVLGLLVVRSRVPVERLMEHHEVAGVCFAVVGGLYGIILAFVLVSSWERYETARAQTEVEASAAADLYRHSEGMSEPTRDRLGKALVTYVKSVIDEEWPAMRTSHASQVTQQKYFDIWAALLASRPTESWEVALYQNSLEKLDQLADARRNRIFYINAGLPRVIWFFLITLGVVTVCFTYLFGMRRLLPQVVITVVLAATVSWTLALVQETQTPFAGELRAPDRAFRVALDFMYGRPATEEAGES